LGRREVVVDVDAGTVRRSAIGVPEVHVMNVLVVLAVWVLVGAGAVSFLVALASLDARPHVTHVHIETLQIAAMPQPSPAGVDWDAEFRALDRRNSGG
jgi:hypothetical protein